MVKSVIFGSRRGEDIAPETDALVLALVSADRSVDKKKLAMAFGTSEKRLYMLSPLDMESRTGFSQGAIPPFGMPKDVEVVMDANLETQAILWMGTGKSTESFRMPPEDLKLLSHCSVSNISRGAKSDE